MFLVVPGATLDIQLRDVSTFLWWLSDLMRQLLDWNKVEFESVDGCRSTRVPGELLKNRSSEARRISEAADPEV